MALQIVSDLHLETPATYDLFDIPAQAPFLALLGDVGNVRDDGFFEFIEGLLSKFRIVFLVLGNHEPYYSSWTAARAKVHAFSDTVKQQQQQHKLGEFVLLDQTRYDLAVDDTQITILGCTLHSHIMPAQEERVSFGLNDFYHIHDWTVDDHNAAHRSDVQWLNAQVGILRATAPERQVVVLTHHCPVVDPRALDPVHANSPISSAFATDLSAEECWRSAQVCLWGFGHTHYNVDLLDGVQGDGEGSDEGSVTGMVKRLVANQRGYYFAQAEGFDPTKIVSLRIT